MPDGYYSGDKPNPNLRRFVEEHATPYDPETDDYDVSAFDEPITSTKSAALYNMHTYWSKKPFDAIQRYIRHYTSNGDLILDPFCGCGSTSLAALLEGRRAISIDRSPAATFITRNYCTPIDPNVLQAAFDDLARKVSSEIAWLYETRCHHCSGKARVLSTVYSQVYQCPRCLTKVAFADCVDAEVSDGKGRAKTIKACPTCSAKGYAEKIAPGMESHGRAPVETSYECLCGCKPARSSRRHSDSGKKGEYFQKYDLAKLTEIDKAALPYPSPTQRMMNAPQGQERWGLLWRPYLRGIQTVADFFTKRNLWAVTCLREKISASEIAPSHLQFVLSAMALFVTIMHQHNENTGGNISKGTYYVPPIFKDMNVWEAFERKFKAVKNGYSSLRLADVDTVISTQSAADLHAIPNNSIDYIFTDPPYSWKVQFGEANFIWEALFGFDTHWHSEEIIVNEVRGATEETWAEGMKKALGECFRVLKPGRWISLCYHDTSEGTWELLQDILAEAGFVAPDCESPLFIETEQKSWKQIVADKVTKRDLVLNFRKPKPGDWRITQVFIPADADVPTFQQLGREVIREFLTAHPGATKDRIYDYLVSHMVRKGQMEAHDFDALLGTVSESMDGRWYLKETADQIDHAEQQKEDTAAGRLEEFMRRYLEDNPEEEGVHYSDLFEQYLPVADKPRRLLADWLPEHFFKTTSGTWRPPANETEREQKAALREKGTLRRIKRFANALIDGVPLADWIQQCRRAGLYEQGRALYEKGGLNLDKLDEVEQIEVEDAYRICVRRGSEEKKKPKRKRRKG